jgi:hypothetical protein
VALRFMVVPFAYREDRDRVSLAIADPRNLHVVDEIQFVLGRGVELYMCPEIGLARALEKYYGVAREKRFIRLDLGSVQPARAASPSREAGGGGVYGSGILERIVRACSKRELLETVVGALTAFGRQVAFLAVNDQRLVGWGARGLSVGSREVQQVALSIGASPVLSGVLSSHCPAVLDGVQDAVLREALNERLFIDCDERVILLPLVVQDQPCGIFVIGRLEERRVADPTLLAELMARVSWRLQALHLMECVSAPLAGCP